MNINIRDNDSVVRFGRENLYGRTYNDILLRYLRLYFGRNSNLPDLLRLYQITVGQELTPINTGASYYVEPYYVERYYV